MNDTDKPEPLAARPGIARHPVHASITHTQIAKLVDDFYDLIWADPRLGPIFDNRVEDREAHLRKMKLFWSSVLLKTGAYKGRPMPAHVKLSEVAPDDFRVWLSIFRPVAREVFQPEAAELVIEAAERIASSLWLGMFGNAFSTAPNLNAEPSAGNSTP